MFLLSNMEGRCESPPHAPLYSYVFSSSVLLIAPVYPGRRRSHISPASYDVDAHSGPFQPPVWRAYVGHLSADENLRAPPPSPKQTPRADRGKMGKNMIKMEEIRSRGHQRRRQHPLVVLEF